MTRKNALILSSLLAVTLSACGDKAGTPTTTTGSDARSSYELETDHAIGDANAPVTIVEYASVVCSHCASWSNDVYPEFKKKYIDTGTVRYVFREFPTDPIQLFDAGVMIANCADDKTPGAFLDSIKLQMERQSEIFRYAQQAPDQLRDQYEFIAKQGGLTAEEMEVCLANDEVRKDYQARSQTGYDLGISGTPGFVINGKVTPKVFKLEDFDRAIAEAQGLEVPEPAETDEG